MAAKCSINNNQILLTDRIARSMNMIGYIA